MIPYAELDLSTADAVLTFSYCILAGGAGFIVGMKLKLIRKIEDMV